MTNYIKLGDTVDFLGLWWLEQPIVILSKFITTAFHKQCKLSDIHASNYPIL